ncbi:HpcH/HpaI aldolase/citrate lyase family protein [Nocardioides sp.]|uniref:HpcH/HpaI aldolase/citrate lyase family protein n=1 Tax=Nocardioides sp. TaxID=35761 RepID=UPI0026041D6A|nr:HpcH/HpaI aldolase/citrate lyase family protein [Nocardioides sp.]
MRHFEFLSAEESAALFSVAPAEFDRDGERDVLATALGATLYSPATRPALAEDLLRSRRRGVLSTVVCLEDAIADADVEQAREHMVAQLRSLVGRGDELPLIFVRVRAVAQIGRIVTDLGPAVSLVSGFVLPKFAPRIGREYLEAVVTASQAAGRHFWAMPVIETPDVIHAETRAKALAGISDLLGGFAEQVLAIRIGGTDFASAYGLRRPKELTIYDVRLLADVLAAIVNRFGRAGLGGYVVTGPVWEYYSDSERLFKPQLRETPFREHQHDPALRAQLLGAELDGLIREAVLDRANGLLGKTVIHPTHVALVHALSVVSHEDHSDALAVLGRGGSGGGAFRSEYRNKMNETSPHRAWAEKTVRRAAAFGVAAPGVTFADLWAAVERG